MNYYSHHIGDYTADAAHLSMLEDGAYRRLLDRYYTTESPLPSDWRVVCRLVRAHSPEECEAIRSVLSEFFDLNEDGWHHKRCDAEILAYQAKAEANRVNGGKGGRPKKTEQKPTENPRKTQVVSENNPRKTQQEPTNNPQITLTNNQEPINKNPHTPKGGESRAIGLKTYLDQCKAEGKKAIAEDDAVFAYAESVGIPQDFLRLQWLEFRDRYTQPGAKRYKAWPIVFNKSVRGNWFRLWYADNAGNYALTTTGQQAQKLHREAA